MKARVLYLIYSYSFIIQTGFAAGEFYPAGGRSLGLGRSSVSLIDSWSVANNQAANAWITKFSCGISIENRYLLSDLSCAVLGLTIPLKPGNIGIVVNCFGISGFSEIKAGISFSRKFGKKISAGVQIDYLRIQISEGYGARNLISFEVGLFFKITQSLNLGLHIANPVPVKIMVHPPEYLPTTIRIGLGYTLSPSFLLLVELEKDLLNKPVFRAGSEIRFAGTACARIGISTNPTLFTFGFGLDIKRLVFDFATGYQPVLGFTPALSFVYRFGKTDR